MPRRVEGHIATKLETIEATLSPQSRRNETPGNTEKADCSRCRGIHFSSVIPVYRARLSFCIISNYF